MSKPRVLYEYRDIENTLTKEESIALESFIESKNLSGAIKITPSKIKAQNYVGVVKYKKHQFEILPKFLAKEEKDRETILKNLFYMLSFTKRLEIKDTDVAKLSTAKNPFLEVLIGIFAESLYENLLRFVPKNYVLHEENLPYLKGKLKFNEHIRYNNVNQARFYCEYDEFSEDNLLNKVFVYVATILSKISSSERNRRRLKQILNILSDVSFEVITPHQVKNLKLNRNQLRYEKAFKLAKMFIDNVSVDMSSNKIQTIAIVWDMNELFEEFIFRFMSKNCHKICCSKIEDKKIKRLFNPPRDLFDDKAEFKYKVGKTELDILVTLGQKQVIFDAKYKLHDGERNYFSNADMYQMITYEDIHNTNEAVLVYPQTTDKPFLWEHNLNSDSTSRTIYSTCIDLRKDLKSKQSEDELISQFKRIINKIKVPCK